jgi:predicted amidohydrolase
MTSSLKVAVVHLSVIYGEPVKNRENILKLAGNAADMGAKIIVTPEMGLTGYRFDDREAIQNYVEPKDGPSAEAFAALAKEKGVYLVTAFGERDRKTGMFYNAAFAFNPDGKLVSHYRKINAESRWACPGDAVQDNVFDTPWGKAGILICSDSYHSLPSRVTALKGADLIILPANWPPTNNFPENIWKFRALENGVWFIACNRTGSEEKFNCVESISHVFSPLGQTIMGNKNPESAVMTADIPLNGDGKFAYGERRKKIISERKPQVYHRIYANLLFFRSITDTLELPKPASLDVHFFASGPRMNPVDFLEERLETLYIDTMVVLPLYPYSDQDVERLEKISKYQKVFIVTGKEDEAGKRIHIVMDQKETRFIPLLEDRFNNPIFVGPSVIYLTTMSEMLHPEPILCAAKKGADLALAIEKRMGPDDRFIVTLRPIDQIAAAFCAEDGAALGLIPEGHVTGRGAFAPAGSDFSYCLDTRILRDKHFQDRIDFETICAGGGRDRDYPIE